MFKNKTASKERNWDSNNDYAYHRQFERNTKLSPEQPKIVAFMSQTVMPHEIVLLNIL